MNIVMTVFNDLNVESENISGNKNLLLVRDLVSWSCALEFSLLAKYFGEAEENVENFFIILNVFVLLYSKLG